MIYINSFFFSNSPLIWFESPNSIMVSRTAHISDKSWRIILLYSARIRNSFSLLAENEEKKDEYSKFSNLFFFLGRRRRVHLDLRICSYKDVWSPIHWYGNTIYIVLNSIWPDKRPISFWENWQLLQEISNL